MPSPNPDPNPNRIQNLALPQSRMFAESKPSHSLNTVRVALTLIVICFPVVAIVVSTSRRMLHLAPLTSTLLQPPLAPRGRCSV